MSFDNGVEQKNVGVIGMVEDECGVRDLMKRGADGDEMGEDLVGLVEAMAEEMSVDLWELSFGFGVVKKMKNFAFYLL
ncbi:hypothetical protein TSUD_34850 [Trifolium subterraneum]|uniref:Uncharacterized protein n=1 Tax=Trifolium subterraneum TaxID=3900 RepID=A0A2Z6M7Y1_TRISU|nr:hypothetical protein TSUD_34850 [Trifolium subterraneum]